MAYIGNSPANIGNYQIVDDISSSFNGSTTSFALAVGGIAISPAKTGQLLVGVNGVMQEPDDTSANGFKVSGSNIVFSSAPASGDTFWAVYQGQEVDIGVPSDDTVNTVHIKDDAVTAAKLANSINTEIAANTAKVTNATHSGEVTGATALTIADNVVDEANLKISNAPTNGYVLTAQSGNTGGLTWAEMTGGGPSLGTDSIIRTNAQTISENITIGSTTNGMSAGPITIADGYTVTVNGNWSVV